MYLAYLLYKTTGQRGLKIYYSVSKRLISLKSSEAYDSTNFPNHKSLHSMKAINWNIHMRNVDLDINLISYIYKIYYEKEKILNYLL